MCHVFRFGERQLFGVDNGFVHRISGGAETGELAVDAVALQHIALRHRLAADLVGDGALDDRPVNAARAGLFLDILEATIDDRIVAIELALDFFRAVAAAPATSVTTVASVSATVRAITPIVAPAALSVSSAIVARVVARFPPTSRRLTLARRASARFCGWSFARPIFPRMPVAASRRASILIGRGRGGGIGVG
ncbi:MAG: hypothetical protein WAV02_01245, partial [Stellaceae bacterium]